MKSTNPNLTGDDMMNESTQQLDIHFVNVSVSTDTLKDEHLVERFSEFLREYAPVTMKAIATQYPDVYTKSGAIRAKHGRKASTPWGPAMVYDFSKVESVESLIESLFDALDSIAPEGTSFGSHEGDGCDFGFFRYEDEENTDI